MTITWPDALPAAPLLESFSETPADTAIRTDMEQGPAKTRRRTTAGVAMLTCVYLLSKSQTAALDAFFAEACAGGALGFVMTHPRTGLSVSCRFTQPPQYIPTNGAYFKAQLKLEVLP